MPSTVNCPCGKSYNIPDELAGKRIRCKACQAVMSIPRASTGFELIEESPAGRTATKTKTSSPPNRMSAPPKPVRADEDSDDEAPVIQRNRRRRPMGDEDDDESPRPRSRKSLESGWFGNSNAGMVGGLIMVVVALVWFVLGLKANRIFFYPPILFVIGVAAIVKGFVRG